MLAHRHNPGTDLATQADRTQSITTIHRAARVPGIDDVSPVDRQRVFTYSRSA